MSEYDYLEELTFRVHLGRHDGWGWLHRPQRGKMIEDLIKEGLLVQVVPKQRTWRTLHGVTEWIGKKIGIR